LRRKGSPARSPVSPEGIAQVLDHIRRLPDCADLDVKLSGAAAMPFHRMKVRVKREIVTMGQPDIDPRTHAGPMSSRRTGTRLIADPDTIVIDTRNDYEVAVGTFDRAIDPEDGKLSRLPNVVSPRPGKPDRQRRPKRVAMFCTGGIRCEKSTAFLKAEGIEEVFHLKGGILKYLETVPEAESLWRGECFVFDERVTVGHGLAPGSHVLCRRAGGR
jgi:UPF0176 protein